MWMCIPEKHLLIFLEIFFLLHLEFIKLISVEFVDIKILYVPECIQIYFNVCRKVGQNVTRAGDSSFIFGSFSAFSYQENLSTTTKNLTKTFQKLNKQMCRSFKVDKMQLECLRWLMDTLSKKIFSMSQGWTF